MSGPTRFLLLLCFGAFAAVAAPQPIFEDAFATFANGLPKGWSKYDTGKAGTISRIALPGGRYGALLTVEDAKQSLGLVRRFPAAGGKYYRASLESSALPERGQKGAFLQIRFEPYPLKTFGNSEYLRQLPLADFDADRNVTDVTLQAPAGTTGAMIYIITAGAAPAVRLQKFSFEVSDTPFAPREADPQIVPGALKITPRDLKIDTVLVRDRRALAAIVAPDAPEYRELAARINRAVKAKTGVELPILKDEAFARADRLKYPIITLGNRDVNRTMANLYNRFYTLIDAKYPGKGGAVVRSVHDPFGGNGGNVITVAGSDFDGDRRAAETFAAILEQCPAGPELKVGYLADIKLGEGLVPPAGAEDAKVWENSPGAGDAGAYGWTVISKNLALFYMTNDERYAREFMRLAFPDDQAAAELNRIDGAFTYANLKNPLGEPYHYNSSMLILHWDLIEEHPFFSDADRVRITGKFYEQLNRRRTDGDKGIYKIYEQKKAPALLPDRHWISEALTVYIAARYFDKYYPCRDGRDGLAAARRQFATLDRYPAMVAGSLFWYNTFLLPAFDFALLDGGLKYVGSPVIDRYVEALTLLADRTPNDWSQEFSTQRLLYMMAYLTQNQAPVELARVRRNFSPDGLRLGQSFWPVKPYERNYFSDTDGKWRRAGFDARGMAEWNPPFDKTRVVEWMSFRRRGAAGEDFALLDAKYESGRNPFHNFALISLYLRGVPLLRGYHNQLHLYRDGLGDPAISRYTEILQSGRAGKTAFVRGKLAQFNGHDWERTILIRENRFLLEIDAVTPRTDTKISEIIANFETPEGAVMTPVAATCEFKLTPKTGGPWTVACSQPAGISQSGVAGGSYLKTTGVNSKFTILTPGKKDEAIRFASVVRPGEPAADQASAAQRGDRIALRLPEPAMLELLPEAGFLLREADAVFGFQVKSIPGVFTADLPVAAEYADGKLTVCAGRKGEITLADGRKIAVGPDRETVAELAAKPALADPSAEAEAMLAAKPKPAAAAAAELPELAEAWQATPGAFVGVHEKIELDGRPGLVVAVDDRALILGYDGKIKREFKSSATVGALCCWPEKKLLLVGSIDEKLRAFTLDGKQLWEFTSQMPDGIKHERMWWAKGEMPGVCKIAVAELEPGKPLIFVGGAGTLEILDANGKLLKRHFQEWGTFEGMTILPAHGQTPVSLLSWGFMVGHPATYRYRADLDRGHLDLTRAKDGSFMSSFGFGFVGRNHLKTAQLTPGGPTRLIGDFNGTVNRVMIWDLDGTVLHEIDLGFGIRAFGGIPYAKTMLRTTNVRGLDIVDFDGKGDRSIAVAFQRRFVAAFDRELKSRFFCPLPENPLLLAVIPGRTGDRLAVGCADGQLLVIDGDGRITGRAKVEGRPTLLASDGVLLVAGTEKGTLTGFKL